MCAGGVIDEVTCGRGVHAMQVNGMRAAFSVLLRHLKAAVDAQDARGRTAVHWLVITACTDYAEEGEVPSKPPDERLKAGLESAGAKPAEDEMDEPWLVSCALLYVELAAQRSVVSS
jgi:hypothetical protein